MQGFGMATDVRESSSSLHYKKGMYRISNLLIILNLKTFVLMYRFDDADPFFVARYEYGN